MPDRTPGLDPVGLAFAGEVGVVVDVADLGITFRVWRRGFRECGHGRGRWVRVENNLVVRAHPAVVPLDDGCGLFPAGLMLTALIGTVGDDDIAACPSHDRTIIVPTIRPASAAGSAVIRIVGEPSISSVFAAHVEDAFKCLEAGIFGDTDGSGARVDWREVLDHAILLSIRPWL